MRCACEVKPCSYMSPVALYRVVRIQASVVKALLLPVLVLILEVLVLLGTFGLLVVSGIFPPDEIVMNFFEEVVGNLHTDLELLYVVNAILKRHIDFAYSLCKL